jgi:cell division septum initiation protein DivIVA
MQTFPTARHGYQRAAVDQFAAEVSSRLARLQLAHDALAADNRRLGAALDDAWSVSERLRTAGVDARGQEILDAAREQAAELLASAQREAEVVSERARQEAAWQKRQLRAERSELAQQQSALRQRLVSLRALALDSARQFPEPPELTFAEVSGGRSEPTAEHHA